MLGSSLLHIIAVGGIVVLWNLDSGLVPQNVIPVEIVMTRSNDSSPNSKKISVAPQIQRPFQSDVLAHAEDAAPEVVRPDHAFQTASEITNPNSASVQANRVANDAEAHILDAADVINLLRAEIERCWFPPSGASPPKEFGIDLHIVLSIDGSIAEPPKLMASGNVLGNDRAQAFIEAAQRAIYTCGPYKLPSAEFGLWHEVDVPRFFPIEK